MQLYDTHPNESEQLKYVLRTIRAHKQELKQKQMDISNTLDEMDSVARQGAQDAERTFNPRNHIVSQYKVPVRDIMFAIEHLGDLEGVSSLPGYEEATPEMINAILIEAGKLAEEVLDPLNRVGDQQGVKLGKRPCAHAGWLG